MASATTDWTVRRILDWTNGYLKEHGSESPRLEAELLLSFACGWPRIQLYTRFDEVLSNDVRGRMRELVKRRGQSEPVAYLIGYREFFSLKFEVGPGVFIPRPETETLVIEALQILKANEKASKGSAKVLDLCTGSGCVAISIAVNVPAVQVVAVEKNEAPLATSRRNAEKHSVADRVDIREGDLFSAIRGDETFDVIVSNPPYVTTDEVGKLQADVKNFEPHAAFDGGVDGLDVVRRIAEQASRHLVPGGALMFEISPEQGQAASEILVGAGFEQAALVKDLSGSVRVVRARRPLQ